MVLTRNLQVLVRLLRCSLPPPSLRPPQPSSLRCQRQHRNGKFGGKCRGRCWRHGPEPDVCTRVGWRARRPDFLWQQMHAGCCRGSKTCIKRTAPSLCTSGKWSRDT